MKLIEEFLKNAKQNDVAIDSIVVESGGGICEQQEINKIALHELRSCAKILIAFSYGIAMDEKFVCKDGKPLSLQTKVFPTLKTLSAVKPDKRFGEWTIKTLLTHSTGFEKMMFNESHVETLNKFKLLDVLFETPLKFEPNTHFTYSNVEPYLLSVFFQENFGMNISDFVNERIFKPLKIKKYAWENFGNYCAGATGLYLNFKDFHKLGQLLFNYGKLDGKQIVPENWVREMTKAQFDCADYYKKERVFPKLAAGYFTWISKDGIIFRDGSEGQYIICDHKNNILITIMATEKNMSKVTECLRGIY